MNPQTLQLDFDIACAWWGELERGSEKSKPSISLKFLTTPNPTKPNQPSDVVLFIQVEFTLLCAMRRPLYSLGFELGYIYN